MLNTKNKKIFDDEISCSFPACECEIGYIPQTKGKKKYTLHLYPTEKFLKFIYRDGKELLLADEKEVLSPVIPDLMSIGNDDVEGVKAFIEKHGFLLLLDTEKNTSVHADGIFALINRFKALFFLMATLGNETMDYEVLTGLTLYLLLCQQVKVEVFGGFENIYFSHQSVVSQLIFGNYQYNDSYKGIKDTEENNDEYFSYGHGGHIADTVRPPTSWLGSDEYINAGMLCDEYPNSIKEKATLLFRDAKYVDQDCCLAIDFLYHFTRSVGDIDVVYFDGKFTFKEKDMSVSERFKKGFDEQLQIAIVKLAKQVLRKELEHGLCDITQTYDTESMIPTKHVSYMLSGLYLSLFNIRSKEEEYRICARPECGRYFFTKKSAVKQKHCCKKCAGAKASNIHRQKKKAQKLEVRP